MVRKRDKIITEEPGEDRKPIKNLHLRR
jgi:hypothetical protein